MKNQNQKSMYHYEENEYDKFLRLYESDSIPFNKSKLFFSKICKKFLSNPESLSDFITKFDEDSEFNKDSKFKEFFIRFFYSLYVKDFSTTKTNKFDQFVFDKLNEIFDLELNDVNKIEDMSNLFSQKKLSSIIDAEATVLTKEQIPQFIEFLKKSTKKEYERKSGIIPDNFSLNKILQNKPDLLNGLDCFQIKEIVDITKKWKYGIINLAEKEKFDYLNKLLKLATYQAVKNSSSFELVDSGRALTEDSFDSKKLSDLKSQFKIEGTLDSEGLMRLFFTLKFFGEENNFISAIKPENLHQNPLLNYNLKLDDQDLKNLHILRSTDDVKNYEELQKNFFQKLEAGDRHFCSSFNRNEFKKVDDEKVGIVCDQDSVPAIHAISDFYSENYPFPNFRKFEGSDVKTLMKFAGSRNCLTYTNLFCKSVCIKIDLGYPLLLKIRSYLNPRQTFREIMEEHLFGSHSLYHTPTLFGSFIAENYDTISSDQIFMNDSRRYIRGGSKSELKRSKTSDKYNESNIYLNLSDIDGLYKAKKVNINDFIDFYTETSLRKKEALNDEDKLSHELSKIKWQKGEFCQDVQKSLTKKLAEFQSDLKILQDASVKCSPLEQSKILYKYSHAYLECSPLTFLAFGQSHEFYDEHDQRLPISERYKMITPQNISIYLQSLIDETSSDLEYLQKLSIMPEKSEIEKKLKRDLNIYDQNSQKISLKEAIIDSTTTIDLIKLYSTENENPRTIEKFKIFVQQLAFEGFFDDVTNIYEKYGREKSRILLIKDQIDKVADTLGINLAENIAIGKARIPSDYSPPPIIIDPPRTIITQNTTLPTQLKMESNREESQFQTQSEIAGSEYQLDQQEISTLLSTYRLQYSCSKRDKRYKISQEYYNVNFGLDLEGFDLEQAINNAFKNLDGTITEYHNVCKIQKAPNFRGRDIHDGHHALTTSFYAKELLKNYQTNRHLFSTEMQAQIAEFDDPQKVKDLEILTIMHDVARTHGGHDQDEYKNAFYVALRLRKLGDPRFQGDKISPEGLKMISDLANKESASEDKSLMSKLIQSADSLAILRCPEFKNGESQYSLERNNVYQDFAKITDQTSRDKELTRLKVIAHLLQENEKEFTPPSNLEFSKNPLEDFSKDRKVKDFAEIFKFQITHDQDGFNKLLEAKCFDYIRSNFSEEQIETFHQKSRSILQQSLTCFTYELPPELRIPQTTTALGSTIVISPLQEPTTRPHSPETSRPLQTNQMS